MTNKNVLITGATGGIGGASTSLFLEHGYTVYGPVRDLNKAEEKTANFPNKENLILVQCNVENKDEARKYIQSLKEKNISFGMIVLAAGCLFYDYEFMELDQKFASKREENAAKKEKYLKLTAKERLPLIELSKKGNYSANTFTKENIIIPFLDFYHDKAKDTILELIGSQAAGFPEGHPWRFTEEGYCFSHVGVRNIKEEYGARFKEVSVEEPPLIETPLTREKFALEDNGKPRDWTKVTSPENYILVMFKRKGYIA